MSHNDAMRTPKQLLLAVGDIAALYAALFLTIRARYGADFDVSLLEHLFPMSVIFVVWLALFYIAGLYDLTRLRNNIEFIKTLWLTLAINGVIAALLFYLVPFFGITPRRNLFLLLIIFTIIETIWRRAANRTLAAQHAMHGVVLGDSETARELSQFIAERPHMGYRITIWSTTDSLLDRFGHRGSMEQFLREHDIDFFVVPLHIKDDPNLKKAISAMLAAGVRMVDLVQFHETIMRKVPVQEVDESWLLEHMGDQHRFYDNLKRAAETASAITLLVLLSPLLICIGALVALTSRGPIFIRQTRVGKIGREFTLYKFRSMIALAPDGQAELHGARWSGHDDPRITPFGKILRLSHLDELPQLVNILKGELSFVGPRPERPEIVKDLRPQVPFYEVRHLVKPGVTGWAQVNYPSDKTIDDVKEKLQYDLYYLKNRSFILDLAIVIRTLKTIFKTPQ